MEINGVSEDNRSDLIEEVRSPRAVIRTVSIDAAAGI
jgi:hypothetical protein